MLGGFLSSGDIHHPAPCFAGKAQNRPNDEDLNKAKNFAQLISGSLMGSNRVHQHLNKNLGVEREFGFYNLIGLVGSSDSMIRLLGSKPRCNHDKCQFCNLCVRECPMDNISLNSFPALKDNYIRCYRCVNACPSKAFSANWWFGNIVLTALYNKSFLQWFGDASKRSIVD